MIEIPLTKGINAIIDDCDSYLVDYKWYAIKGKYTYYAGRREDTIQYLMHRVILGADLDEVVDHKNNIGYDNRRTNIRLCTISQNNSYALKREGTTSVYKGVCWNRAKNKWQAYCGRIYLGLFDSELDAAIRYDEAASRYYKEFARLNFPVVELVS